MQTKTVHVLRAFFWKGKSHAIGSDVTLPASFALDLVATNKAVIVPDLAKVEEVAKTEDVIPVDTRRAELMDSAVAGVLGEEPAHNKWHRGGKKHVR